MITLADYWAELVATALLGADRRDPPTPPAGALADLAADDPQPAPAERLLQQVAACAAVRRAAFTAAPAVALLDGAPDDERPITTIAHGATWRQIIEHWPVLEDEWLLTVVATGRRLAPELVEPLLVRHRNDATRHARVVLAAGELAEWLIGLQPRLAARSTKPPLVEHVVTLPDLAVSPELAPCLSLPADAAAALVADGFARAALGPAHRAVLTNAIARMPVGSLAPVAAVLHRVDPASPAIGIALALADLAELRHRMIGELS
jgi:hypothetical protein